MVSKVTSFAMGCEVLFFSMLLSNSKVSDVTEHYQKIPSIPILGIFQGFYQIRTFDQIRTQQTSFQRLVRSQF
jgi:hypothetical protein